MRTARLAAVLLGPWFLFWGIAARADQPETFERGTGKYILVLKDPRTDADDPVTGKKKAREPDLVRHGGKLLHRKGNTRIIKLPVRAAAALSEEENVAYLQRIWLGEPAEEWTAGPFASSVKADSAVVPHETNLTWETGQYQYDGSGNIQRIGDDTYEYDTLGRLKKAVLNGVTASYQYDAFGNLVAQTVGGVTRATPVDASSNRLQGETYDLAGNLTTQDRTPVYHYDSFSMIDRVQKRRTGAITDQRILYGPDDERIGTVREEGIRSRWTIRDFGGKVLTEYEADDENGHWTWSRDYVYGGDGRLLGADRHSYHGGQRHLHLDHLGTVRMITNQERQRISVHELYPFGVEQTDATQEHNRLVPDGVVGSAPEFRSEPMKFTGHERDWHGWLNVDNDEYLDYMHARYYDPNLGRFLSVDPVMEPDEYLREPQRWNRYAYATNNPLKNVDPDGKRTRVFIVSSGGDLFSRQGHAALYVETPRGNAGVSLGTTVGFSRGAQGFIDEYNAQGRTVTSYDMKVSPQNEEAIRSFINSDPAAGTDSNKNIQARMMLAENCATGVCNALAAGGVGTNTPGKRAATSLFGTERPFTLQNNLERGPLSVFVGQRVVFVPGKSPSQPQQVPGQPAKIDEPKLCVFCSIQ